MKNILILLLIFPTVSFSETLKDPINRNEDISLSTVTGEWTKRSDGNYEYTYNIVSPPDNKGRIIGFNLDINCALDFGAVNFTEENDSKLHSSESADGAHVPVQLFSVHNVAFQAIAAANSANWGFGLNPGDSVIGIRIVSPAPPGVRQYQLVPSYTPFGWDYAKYENEDLSGYTVDLPNANNFIVHGQTIGPACAFAPIEEDKYLGSRSEPYNVNSLLSYTKPIINSITVDDQDKSITMTIHYADGIVKKSFEAKMNGKDISFLFNPVPGTKQTVNIPIERTWPPSRLTLSVNGVVDGRVKGKSQEKRPDRSWNTPAKDKSAIGFDQFRSKDNDDFHIYRR